VKYRGEQNQNYKQDKEEPQNSSFAKMCAHETPQNCVIYVQHILVGGSSAIATSGIPTFAFPNQQNKE